jgi:hypothetical protein
MLWWQQGGGFGTQGKVPGAVWPTALPCSIIGRSVQGRNRESRSGGPAFSWPRFYARFGPPPAASTVLYSSIARVIGPTPPGTGVIADAFSATAA